jgi:hypothetical protein
VYVFVHALEAHGGIYGHEEKATRNASIRLDTIPVPNQTINSGGWRSSGPPATMMTDRGLSNDARIGDQNGNDDAADHDNET